MHQVIETDAKSQKMVGVDNELGVDSDDEDLMLEMMMRNEGMLSDSEEKSEN